MVLLSKKSQDLFNAESKHLKILTTYDAKILRLVRKNASLGKAGIQVMSES